MASQLEARRDAEDRGDGEGAHHRAESATAPLGGDDVGDDRERDRRRRAAEDSGDDPRGDQGREARREAAGEGAEHEAEHRHAERAAAIEPVEEERAGEAGDGGGCGVAAADVAEVRGGDAEADREIGPQRHHHDEVEDVDELNRADEKDDRPLGGDSWHEARLLGSDAQEARPAVKLGRCA